MLPAGMTRSSDPRPVLGHFFAAIHRHQHAKNGAIGLAVARDDAAMIADDFGDERESEPASTGLGGDEGIEQMRHEVLGYARTVVDHAKFERQARAHAGA